MMNINTQNKYCAQKIARNNNNKKTRKKIIFEI